MGSPITYSMEVKARELHRRLFILYNLFYTSFYVYDVFHNLNKYLSFLEIRILD